MVCERAAHLRCFGDDSNQPGAAVFAFCAMPVDEFPRVRVALDVVRGHLRTLAADRRRVGGDVRRQIGAPQPVPGSMQQLPGSVLGDLELGRNNSDRKVIHDGHLQRRTVSSRKQKCGLLSAIETACPAFFLPEIRVLARHLRKLGVRDLSGAPSLLVDGAVAHDARGPGAKALGVAQCRELLPDHYASGGDSLLRICRQPRCPGCYSAHVLLIADEQQLGGCAVSRLSRANELTVSVARAPSTRHGHAPRLPSHDLPHLLRNSSFQTPIARPKSGCRGNRSGCALVAAHGRLRSHVSWAHRAFIKSRTGLSSTVVQRDFGVGNGLTPSSARLRVMLKPAAIWRSQSGPFCRVSCARAASALGGCLCSSQGAAAPG
jgi:hypothetical protein